MLSRYLSGLTTLATIAFSATTSPAWSAEAVAEAAAHEGRLIVYGSTSAKVAWLVVDDFKAMHPGIDVAYTAMPPAEIDRRFRADLAAGSTPDVVWSIAMDLQMRLALEGHALAYRPSEAAALPAWAQWRNQLYGTTYEPVALAYSRRLVPPDEVPATHADLTKLLFEHADKYQNRITTYHPNNPEIGALAFRQDAAHDRRFWKLADAMGARGVDLRPTTDAMMDRISSGESLFAYDVAASEAIARAKRDPSVAIRFLEDYDLVLSRVMFIARNAAHPNAAKLWVDYILSLRGQTQMRVATLYPIREDVGGTEPGVDMLRSLSRVSKPIALEASLAKMAEPRSASDFDKELQVRFRRVDAQRREERSTRPPTASGSAPGHRVLGVTANHAQD
jgi:iron(III) transport system substrate-binding protein